MARAGRTIGLASGVLPEFPPETTARAAGQAGFDAVGLWVEPGAWTDATTREVRRIVEGDGLSVIDVEVIWIQPGPDNMDHFRIIDRGAEVGAANVLVVSSDPDVDATAEKFGRLCDHAAASGLRASLEFGAFTQVASLADAIEVIARSGRASAGLLVDPLHFARTGGTPEELAGIDPARFSYAQFCDAPATGPAVSDTAGIIEEAVDGRLIPGEGALPLHALLARLPADLPLSVELRSKALREGWPDPVERARHLARRTRAFLAA